MTLIDKWKAQNADIKIIHDECNFLINNTQNGLEMFINDGNKTVKYCVPCDISTNTYGRYPGICYAEKIAHVAIKEILSKYTYLLAPWILQDTETTDLYLTIVSTPISYVIDENGVQKDIFDCVIVFEKCENKIGFYVKSITPLLDKMGGGEI